MNKENIGRLLDIMVNPFEHAITTKEELNSFIKDKDMKELVVSFETGFEQTAFITLLVGPNPNLIMAGSDIYKSLGLEFEHSGGFMMSEVMDAKRNVMSKCKSFVTKHFPGVNFLN